MAIRIQNLQVWHRYAGHPSGIRLVSRFCTMRHHSSFPRLKPMHAVSTPARKCAKSRLAVRRASHSTLQSPSPSFPVLTFWRTAKHFRGSDCLHEFTNQVSGPHRDRSKLRTIIVLSPILAKLSARLHRLSQSSQSPSEHIATSPRFLAFSVPNR